MIHHHPRRDRRGIAAVEFALTVGVLLAVLLGIVELSMLMARQYVVSRAARDACRVGSGVLEGANPTGDQITAAADAHAKFALDSAGVPCTADNCTVTSTWYDSDGWYVLKVVVAVDYKPLTGQLPMIPNETRSQFIMLTQQQIWQ